MKRIYFFLTTSLLFLACQSNQKETEKAMEEEALNIPEHHHLINDTALNWDLRARGLGGDLELPLTSCAEEHKK